MAQFEKTVDTTKAATVFIVFIGALLLAPCMAAAQRFSDQGDGTVLDHSTGLIWLQNPIGPYNFDDANTNCASITLRGGGWHLPTIEDLEMVGTDPPTIYCPGAYTCYNETPSNPPWVNPGAPFTNLAPSGPRSYWSRTKFSEWYNNVEFPGYFCLTINSIDGGILFMGQSHQSGFREWVWPVKYPEGYTAPTVTWNDRFQDNNDGTILDKSTGLFWLKEADPVGMMVMPPATGAYGVDAIYYAAHNLHDMRSDPNFPVLDGGNNLMPDGTVALADGSSEGQWDVPTLAELEQLGSPQTIPGTAPAPYCPGDTGCFCQYIYPTTWTNPGLPFLNLGGPYTYWSKDHFWGLEWCRHGDLQYLHWFYTLHILDGETDASQTGGSLNVMFVRREAITATSTTTSVTTTVSAITTSVISSTTTTTPPVSSTTTTTIPRRLLKVTKIGTGTGTVTGTGIDCGSDCTELFDNGTIEVLTAAAAGGSTFDGWSGACTGTGTCTLDMNDNKTATATFTLIPVSSTTTIAVTSSSTTTTLPLLTTTTTIKPQRKLTVTKISTGTGTVTGGSISCGSTCTETVDNGTIVTLTATPDGTSTFGGWSGACSGTGTCSLDMNDNKTAIATFTLIPVSSTTTIAVSSTTTTAVAPAGVFKDDFNGDTISDILLKNAAGSLYVLAGKADGVAYGLPARIYKESTPATYTVVGTGDFNGDGNSDILLKNSAGSLYVLFGKDDGVSYATSATRIYKESTPATYSVVGTGDFNGDTHCDILLKNAAGSLYVLAGKADGVAYGLPVRIYKETIPATYRVAGTGDFNGDNKCDILLKNAAGSLYVLLGKADGVAYGTPVRIYKESTPASYSVAGTGDFNGDGNCDILLKNAAGSLYVLFGKADGVAYATTATRIYKETSPVTYLAVLTGDYNGDGKCDILLKNSAGSLYVLAGKDDGVAYGLPARIYKESTPATYSVVGY